MKDFYVYILSNSRRTVYYTGVTNNLERRLTEHRTGIGSKFCKRYNIFDLVYYEVYDSIIYAISREKKVKKMSREKKLQMIRELNPGNRNLL